MPMALIASIQFLLLSTQLKDLKILKLLLLLFLFLIAIFEDNVVFPKGGFTSYKVKGAIGNSLELIPADSTFAVFSDVSQNLSRTSDFSAKLICRHHYILDHVYEFYTDEINACISKEPDYIFLNELALKTSLKRTFFKLSPQIETIKNDYYFCHVNSFGIAIYAFDSNNCRYFGD